MGSPEIKKSPKQLTAEELLHRMLNTPPQPHKKPKAKKPKANKKKLPQ